MFYFQGIQRLQLFFDSPNKLAVFLCMIIFLCFGSFLTLIKSSSQNCRRLSWVCLPFLIILEIMLLMTYSRGGYVAFAVCLIVLFCTESRKWSLFLASCWGIGLLVLPKTLVRSVDMNLAADLSIQHRLILWKHACNMVYSYFPFGIDKSFEQLYWAWYQPLEKRQTYITAVNDYLTLGVNYGMLLLIFYLFVISFAVIALFVLRITTQKSCYSGLVGAVIAYIVASIFSTFYNNYIIFPIFICLILLSLVLAMKIKERIGIIATWAIGVSAAVAFLLIIIGVYSKHFHDLRYEYQQIGSSECVILRTSHSVPKKIIVYLFDQTEFTLEYEGKISLRRLLNSECHVIGMGVEPDESGLENCRQLLKYIDMSYQENLPVYLIGQNCGGRYAILLAGCSERIKGIATIGAYAQWPLDNLSPISNLENLREIPLLIIHGENDLRVSCEEARKLSKACNAHQVNNQLLIIEGETNYLGSTRETLLPCISEKLRLARLYRRF